MISVPDSRFTITNPTASVHPCTSILDHSRFSGRAGCMLYGESCILVPCQVEDVDRADLVAWHAVTSYGATSTGATGGNAGCKCVLYE